MSEQESSIRLTFKSKGYVQLRFQAVIQVQEGLCVVNVFTQAETDAGRSAFSGGTRMHALTATCEQAGGHETAPALHGLHVEKYFIFVGSVFQLVLSVFILSICG